MVFTEHKIQTFTFRNLLVFVKLVKLLSVFFLFANRIFILELLIFLLISFFFGYCSYWSIQFDILLDKFFRCMKFFRELCLIFSIQLCACSFLSFFNFYIVFFNILINLFMLFFYICCLPTLFLCTFMFLFMFGL